MSSPALARLRAHCSLRRCALYAASHSQLSTRPRTSSLLSWSASLSCSLRLASPSASPTRALSTSPRAEKKLAYQRRGYQDRVRIQATGGRGGHGCSSFARTHKGIGAPNGGSGGRGGDVFVQCADDSHRGLSFSSFHFRGGSGQPGLNDAKGGRRGADVVVHVPRGTLVHRIVGRDDEGGELRTELIADLDETGARVLVARGGEGGWGNRAFVTGYRSNNRFSSAGGEGESAWLLLELRLIADVGLVGFPNAGKSSLLDAVSNAAPKVASYPFTTLQPQVGVVEVGRHRGVGGEGERVEADAATAMEAFTMADLPGLIDDAHLDVGLGHSFLQHLTRCPLLLYVLDVAGAGEGRDPCDDFVALRRELRLYDEALLKKPWLVFANQMDRGGREAKRNLRRLTEVVQAEVEMEGGRMEEGGRVLSGSCVTRQGIDALVWRLWEAKTSADAAKAREKAVAERRMAAEQAEAEERRELTDVGDRQRRPRELHRRRRQRRVAAALSEGEAADRPSGVLVGEEGVYEDAAMDAVASPR